MLKKIMDDVYGDAQFKNISDESLERLAYKINELVSLQGYVGKELHYFRNELNRAPNTLEEMIVKANNKEWKLMAVEGSQYHMYGVGGEFNLKFVSTDGLFEAVYDRNGNLLTDKNSPQNMGTYNYAYPVSYNHIVFDVQPWEKWGNVRGVPNPQEDMLKKYNSNPYAQQHRADIIKQINGK